MEDLHKRREPLGFEAIYIITPIEKVGLTSVFCSSTCAFILIFLEANVHLWFLLVQSVKQLIQDMSGASPQYRAAHVFFTEGMFY